MKEINISGKKREALGKKASKALRKEGFVPCNLYGEAKDENGNPVALAFASPFSELRKVIYTPHIYVIKVTIDGEDHTAILKEIQFHPVTDAPLHVDFYEVNDQKPITIGIPVKLNGLAQGVRDGGRMNLSIRKINVTARPFLSTSTSMSQVSALARASRLASSHLMAWRLPQARTLSFAPSR